MDKSKLDLLLEAENRGILPQEMQAALDEGRKRGIVPPLTPERSLGERAARILPILGEGAGQGAMQMLDVPGQMVSNFPQALTSATDRVLGQFEDMGLPRHPDSERLFNREADSPLPQANYFTGIGQDQFSSFPPETRAERIISGTGRVMGVNFLPTWGVSKLGRHLNPTSGPRPTPTSVPNAVAKKATEDFAKRPGTAITAETIAAAGGGAGAQGLRELGVDHPAAILAAELAASLTAGGAFDVAANAPRRMAQREAAEEARAIAQGRTTRIDRDGNVVIGTAATNKDIGAAGVLMGQSADRNYIQDFEKTADKAYNNAGVKLGLSETSNDPFVRVLQEEIVNADPGVQRLEMLRQENNRLALDKAASGIEVPGSAGPATDEARRGLRNITEAGEASISGAEGRALRGSERAEDLVQRESDRLADASAATNRARIEGPQSMPGATREATDAPDLSVSGEAARVELKRAMDVSNAETRAAWAEVDPTVTVDASGVERSAREALATVPDTRRLAGLEYANELAGGAAMTPEMKAKSLSEGTLAADVAETGKKPLLSSKSSVDDVLGVAGKLAEDIRIARADGRHDLARVLSKIQDDVLETLETIPGDPATKARARTKQHHDEFTRSEVGPVLGSKKDADVKVEPSQVLSRFVKAEGAGGREAMDDLYRVADKAVVDKAVDSHILRQMVVDKVFNADGTVNSGSMKVDTDPNGAHKHVWERVPGTRE